MTGSGDSIFLMAKDGLVEMRSAMFESEDDLQDLVARYPALLAGGQMTPGDPRRWMLVRREMGVPSREGGAQQWSADHLFLDQDGVPTIVEVKRSTDTRIRREVVGQMLDYAANAVRYWPVEDLRATHEAACRSDGRDPEAALAELLGETSDPDAYWGRVSEHLASGRIRMVFVADVVPPELQRIVEFLNEGMTRAQVYAGELPQYVGAEQRSLVPRLVGATSAARQNPHRDRSSPGIEALLASAPDHVRIVDDGLRRWAAEHGYCIRNTSSGRNVSTDEMSLGMLYPSWKSLEVYLGPIREAGLHDVAADLHGAFDSLCASKAVTESSPNLATADLARNWERATLLLDRYVEARLSARSAQEPPEI